MTSTAELVLRGIALGLGAAVPIGPVNVEIARRALRSGFWAGFALGCGAVTVDVCYAVVASLGVRPLVDQPWVYWPLAIGGMALLAYMGIACLRAAWRARRNSLALVDAPAGESGPPQSVAAATSHRSAYLAGLLMTLLNPMTLAFWFLVLPSLQVPQITGPAASELPIMCVGVFVGTIAWVCTFSGTVAVVGSFGNKPAWIVAADALGGLILLGFAGGTLARAVSLWWRSQHTHL